MKKIEESAAIYTHYFLNALGYSSYSPLRKNLMEKKQEEIMMESKGAILHNYYHLQAYPYLSSGDYDNMKKDGKGQLLRHDEIIARFERNGEKIWRENKKKICAYAKKNMTEKQYKKFISKMEKKYGNTKVNNISEGINKIRLGKRASEVVDDLI